MRDLTRRTATGADAGDMEYPTRALAALPADHPCDCVRAVQLSGNRTQLLGFDTEGLLRATMTLPTGKVEGMDEMWLLDRVRRMTRLRPRLSLVG